MLDIVCTSISWALAFILFTLICVDITATGRESYATIFRSEGNAPWIQGSMNDVPSRPSRTRFSTIPNESHTCRLLMPTRAQRVPSMGKTSRFAVRSDAALLVFINFLHVARGKSVFIKFGLASVSTRLDTASIALDGILTDTRTSLIVFRKNDAMADRPSFHCKRMAYRTFGGRLQSGSFADAPSLSALLMFVCVVVTLFQCVGASVENTPFVTSDVPS